jgi:hypothetical protein
MNLSQPGAGLILGCIIGALLWAVGIAVTLYLWSGL